MLPLCRVHTSAADMLLSAGGHVPWKPSPLPACIHSSRYELNNAAELNVVLLLLQVVNPHMRAHLYTWGAGHVTAEGERIPVKVGTPCRPYFCRSAASRSASLFAMQCVIGSTW